MSAWSIILALQCICKRLIIKSVTEFIKCIFNFPNSARIGRQEDLEDIRMEEEEKKRKMMRKKQLLEAMRAKKRS